MCSSVAGSSGYCLCYWMHTEMLMIPVYVFMKYWFVIIEYITSIWNGTQKLHSPLGLTDLSSSV